MGERKSFPSGAPVPSRFESGDTNCPDHSLALTQHPVILARLYRPAADKYRLLFISSGLRASLAQLVQ